MKALLSEVVGGPETLRLREIPVPILAAGEILIRVKACAINYPDALIIEDKYQFKPARPFAPGGEVAGVIEATGDGVEGWAVGDRVIAASVNGGGLAELLGVSSNRAFPLPGTISFGQGSTLLMTYATTVHALCDRGQLSAGETLLVLGAAGGTGIAAIEIGKALGARVVAAVSSEEKAAAAKEVGADDCVVYAQGPFDSDALRRLTQQFKAVVGAKGADVIYDPVGGDYAEPALRALGWAGRYLVIGFTAGIPRIPLNLALLKGCDVRGVFWGEFMDREPEQNRRNVERLFDWHAAGLISPRIDRTLPLENGADAIRWVSDRRAIGKVAVEVADAE